MIIESYDVAMQSTSSYIQKHESSITTTQISQELDAVQKKDNIAHSSISTNYNRTIIYNSETNMSYEDRIKKLLIEMLLGIIKRDPQNVEIYPFKNPEVNKSFEFNPDFSPGISINAFAASYESVETYYQKSSVSFSSNAQINTKNGSFNIDLDLSFSQVFYEQHKTKIEFAAVAMQDPLIINFEDSVNSFDNISQKMTFEFDINNDNSKENIPMLKKGSGFLALDKNNNGNIDNGNELFGAKTGDGFEELAQYDEDGNNWIDEADSIFNSLKIWQINEDGDNQLISLSDANVGAIYLSSIGSGFNYSKGIGEQTANLKESSIYLKENGEAGIVTSVDLVV